MYIYRADKTRLLLWLCCALLLILALTAAPAYADDDTVADAEPDNTIKLYVNDQMIEMDTAPFIENGRTMVPARYATEPLGAVLGWKGGEVQCASVRKDNTLIAIYVGKTVATVNGEDRELDAAAAVRDSRVFVPLRFIGESIGAYVEWRPTEKAVYISTAPANDNITETPEQRDFEYYGYYYTSVSQNDLKNYQNELTAVSHFAYSVAANGTITENKYFATDNFYTPGGGYATARAAGLTTQMLVTGFSKSDLSAMLSSQQSRATAIAEITRLITLNGLSGVDLDFESVAADQRDNFSAFVKELRAALGSGKQITLSLMPRSNAGQFWLDGYDYYTLSLYADKLILMCYNEHYSGSSPGPVASSAWLKKVLDYTTGLGVAPEKIICALGSYGYNWPQGGKGSSTTNTNARNLAAKYGATIYRDTISGCPYFNYTSSDGSKREVWFEDSRSLAAKAKIAYDYGCSGIAIWRLGFLTDEIWAQLLSATNHPNAAAWLEKAPLPADFPVNSVNTESGIDMENNGEIVQEGI